MLLLNSNLQILVLNLQYLVLVKKHLYLSGLNNPDVFKFFSTTFEISDPIFFFLSIFSKFFFEFSSIDNGETAIGSGFKFPLVISTSIKAKALNW